MSKALSSQVEDKKRVLRIVHVVAGTIATPEITTPILYIKLKRMLERIRVI